MIDLSAARHIQSRSGHARPKPCSLYGVTCLPVSVGGAKAEAVGGDVSQRGQGVAGATHTDRDEGADPAGERQAPLKPLARQFLDGVSRHVPSRWGWLAGRANILTGAPSVRLLHPKLFSCLLGRPAAAAAPRAMLVSLLLPQASPPDQQASGPAPPAHASPSQKKLGGGSSA